MSMQFFCHACGKLNPHRDAEGVPMRSRNGALFRRGFVVTVQMTKDEQKKEYAPSATLYPSHPLQ